MNLLSSISRNIYPLNKRCMDAAQERWNNLIHPKGSLGRVEDICVQMAGIYETEKFDIPKKAIIAFGADHGVYEEGVAPNSQDITKIQFPNFAKGLCGVGALSRYAGADMVAVDVGINCDEPLEGIINRKIRKGTSNMAKGPAMTREEAVKSIEIGIEIAEECIVKDYRIIGIGEMGIANTTPSTAIISVMTGKLPEEITGSGSGLSAEIILEVEKMNLLSSISRNIYPLNKRCMDAAQERWNNLIHPKGSLGRVEDICVQMAGIYETEKFDIPKKAIIAFGADHGVYEEGVAPNSQDITKIQFPNFAKGLCGVGALSRYAGADMVAVDVGINCDEPLEGIINRKIRKGTSNMAKGPAMTREEAVKSIEIGIEIAEECIVKDYRIIGIGEMGIANTTPSTAIISVMTGKLPEEITGSGSGLSADKIKHKAQVIGKAIELNNPNPTDGIEVLEKIGGFEIGAMTGVIMGCAANRIPVVIDGYISYAAALINPTDGIEVLEKIGGFEIGAMTGVIMGCAANRIPVVIDGYISYAAALIAYKINPGTRDYLIASHKSDEPGSDAALELLKLTVVIDGYISYAAALIAYKINPGTRDYLIASHKSDEPGSDAALELLKLSPILNMNMRLGEGSGAALAFNVIDASVYAYNNMATFEEVGMKI